jgi:hypothetical protein
MVLPGLPGGLRQSLDTQSEQQDYDCPASLVIFKGADFEFGSF